MTARDLRSPIPDSRMQRILVVLPNWYGETLFTTPFLRALRAQRPGAFIAALGWPQCRDVLLHNPRINAILTYDEQGADRSLLEKWRLAAWLRAQRFGLAYILRPSLSRTLLMVLAGIPQRVGFDTRKSGWLLTHRIRLAAAAGHKAVSYLRLLACVSDPGSLVPYEYFVGLEERQRVDELLPHAQRSGPPLTVLHPGANWPHKRWAAERFAELGDRLAQAGSTHIVLTGASEDVSAVQAIAQRMRHPPRVLAGQTTLRQLGACLERASLVISNDTGVLHLAAALGRPLIGLYGPTAPMLTGPLGDPAKTIVLHHPDCCPQVPCYHPDRPPHPGMDSISVEEVYAAAMQLLEENR